MSTEAIGWGAPIEPWDRNTDPEIQPPVPGAIFVDTPEKAVECGLDPNNFQSAWYKPVGSEVQPHQSVQTSPAVVQRYTTPDGATVVQRTVRETTTRETLEELVVRSPDPVERAYATRMASGVYPGRPAPQDGGYMPATRTPETPQHAPTNRQLPAAPPAAAEPTGVDYLNGKLADSEQGTDSPAPDDGQPGSAPETRHGFVRRHMVGLSLATVILAQPAMYATGYQSSADELPSLTSLGTYGNLFRHVPDVIGDTIGLPGAIIGTVKGIAP